MIRATVSGSFRKHMRLIADAVHDLHARDVRVLSPSDPTVVDQTGEFLFVASDAVRSIRMVQDRHMEAVRAADLLWLVCPDGYVGQSASMEIGFAAAVGTPVFSTGRPDDLTLSHYVHVVPGVDAALGVIRALKVEPEPVREPTFLLEPFAALDRAHAGLERIRSMLAKPSREVDDVVGRKIYSVSTDIRSALPPFLQL